MPPAGALKTLLGFKPVKPPAHGPIQVAFVVGPDTVLIDVAVSGLHLPLAELLVLAFVFVRLVPQITQAQSNMQTLAQSLPAFDEVTAVIEPQKIDVLFSDRVRRLIHSQPSV